MSTSVRRETALVDEAGVIARARSGAFRVLSGLAGLAIVVGLSVACSGNEPDARVPDPPAGDRTAAAEAARARGAPNVILISIDSLRPDHLGCYGYARDTSPFLDSLARDGVRFDDAVSTTSWTLPSHAAMFTGLYDTTHGVIGNGLALSPGLPTLAETLRDAGYATAGFYGGPYLHPTFGLDRGFDVYRSCMTTISDDASDDDVRSSAMESHAPSHRDVTGPRTRREIGRWIADGVAEPYFLFVHLWDVHYDYDPPPGYVERFDPDYDGPITGKDFTTDPHVGPDMTARDLEHLVARYDGEIRFTDDVLRGIFADLEGAGLLDDTVTVVTADHGEEFLEHGDVGHQRTLYDEVLKIPLIVHAPGRFEPGVVDRQVRIIDLYPTLASIAGAGEDRVVQGRDLGPLLAGETLPPESALAELLVNDMSLRALRTEDWKLVRDGNDAPELFLDAAELEPIGPDDADPDRLARAEHALDDALAAAVALATRLGGDRAETEVDPELLERLRSLGYLGD